MSAKDKMNPRVKITVGFAVVGHWWA